MKAVFFSIVILVFFPPLVNAQQIERRENYNISKDKVLYTVGYAHLDTEWNWDYPRVINVYIKNTMVDNFKLFDKYPDYVFNFTGSRRYHMMKEYYPELYKRVINYIKQGRWYISGSSVDEAEVNISSSESVLRQVLYGNLYFKREFEKQSMDYMLPDCFGFVATLPSVLSHAGLIGFSTQKLTWHSANGIPFNVGLWEGPDGKTIPAALNATSYNGHIVERLDKNPAWTARMESNLKKYDIPFDFRYYGIGDEGGAPREQDVINAMGSIKKGDSSNFKVILTSSDQLFKDITPELRNKLPTYSGDLLLIEHSAGSMTSESFQKRANRKNELLAKSAEQLAAAADWLGAAEYPMNKINNSWDLVLGSQFHDILPGTAFPKAYEYAWNDEFIAMNGFSEVLKNSVSAISHQLNTQTTGRPLVVYNPVALDREDLVLGELRYEQVPEHIQVFDKNGSAVPTQVLTRTGNAISFIFLADVPGAGLSVYDVRETKESVLSPSSLSAKNTVLENEYYTVTIDINGDIASIYEKTALKEVLSQPASLQFLKENPSEWPAWNMDWKDRKNPPIDFMNKDVSVKIIENGPVRVAIEVRKKGQNSDITQIVSLAAGKAGKRIEISNQIDWQSKGVSLKASFPVAAINEQATYGMSTAAIRRSTNNDVKYEVPGRQWIDLTDRSNSFGVSILEDCKYGSDKPDNSTLRLTLMYTPKANSYIYQGSQDWGIHNFKYAVYPHGGDWAYAKTPWQGAFLNVPLIAFETGKHLGPWGKAFSLFTINTDKVDLLAFKKAEESDYYIVRFNELYGQSADGVSVSFPGKILDAFEVDGQEKKTGPVDFTQDALHFNMSRFLIRSFAVRFEKSGLISSIPKQSSVIIPFNEDVISSDLNRADGNMVNGLSFPAELIPSKINSEDILFSIGSTADGEKNALAANGQEIHLPEGEYNKLYIVAASTKDTSGEFGIGKNKIRLGVQNWTGFVGQHYGRKFTDKYDSVTEITTAFSKRDNIAWYASHSHSPNENLAYQYSYLYKYELKIPKGVKLIQLPKNPDIKIFAITAANVVNEDVSVLQPLYDEFSGARKVPLR